MQAAVQRIICGVIGMDEDLFLYEVDALQRWIKGAINVNSFRLGENVKVARPVFLFETAQRTDGTRINAYSYVENVNQYGKFFISKLADYTWLTFQLKRDLENKFNVIPVYNAANAVIGYLKNVQLKFSGGDTLDVPFQIRYEVTYSREKPAAFPPATTVGTRIQVED